MRYTLKHAEELTALTRHCEDGDLEIENKATERSIRSVAVGRRNWIFFGSDQGGKTAAVCGASWLPASGPEWSLSRLVPRRAGASCLPSDQSHRGTRPDHLIKPAVLVILSRLLTSGERKPTLRSPGHAPASVLVRVRELSAVNES